MDPPAEALTPGRPRWSGLQLALDIVYGLAIFVVTGVLTNSLLSRAVTILASNDPIDPDRMFALVHVLASCWSIIFFLLIMTLDWTDRIYVRADLAGLVAQLVYTDKLSHRSIHAVGRLEGHMIFARWAKVVFEAVFITQYVRNYIVMVYHMADDGAIARHEGEVQAARQHESKP